MSTNKQEKLRKLQGKYIAQLPGKFDSMKEAWLQVLEGDNTTAFEELQHIVHSLAGSAGTFGFSAISTNARMLENLFNKLPDKSNLSETFQEQVNNTFQHIHDFIEQGPEHPETPSNLMPEQLKPMTDSCKLIYIIEDDELLAFEIATQLNYFDYDVKIFTSLNQANQALDQQIPSAMIVDVRLPEGKLAGPEFIQQFNTISTKQVPTIFISAIDDWQARLAAVQAGGSAYLTKPIDFNDLLERLDQLCENREHQPCRILIIDDMEVLAEHYSAVLRGAGMVVKAISDMDDLLETLSEFKPELILMDIYMPQCSGLEVARIIRQKEELLGIPIVFLSTESDPLQHLTAMELGGDDFLQKPIIDQRLVVAVRARARRFRTLRGYMQHDSLTNLLNHATIKSHLLAEITRAQRQQEPLCLAMLDIDHFKQVNDNYGHPVGDRVIKSVARMLTTRLRKSDLVGRYGGEEFAIILPETKINEAKSLLEDIRLNFSKIIQQSRDEKFNCTLSAGVTQMAANSSLNSMISSADRALYEAKHSGRNMVCTL